MAAHNIEVCGDFKVPNIQFYGRRYDKVKAASNPVISFRCSICDFRWNEGILDCASYASCPSCNYNSERKVTVLDRTYIGDYPIISRKFPGEEKECIVCCDNRQRFVQCKMCDFECCDECLKRYTLECNDVFRCMKHGCGAVFPPRVIRETYDYVWLKDDKKGYAKHLLNIDLENAKAKFPSDMVYVDDYIKYKKVAILYNKILVEHDRSTTEEVRVAWMAAVLELHDEYTRQENALYERIERDNGTRREYPKIVQSCPAENCRGLIGEDFSCMVCKIKLCTICRCKMSEEHVCNPDDIETVKSMKDNTKPCPKCAALIFKIDGCDQMFCTKCHTSFSWERGIIQNGPIHNPHYFEWLTSSNEERTLTDDFYDVPCGELPTDEQLYTLIKTMDDTCDARFIRNLMNLTAGRVPDVLNFKEAEIVLARLRYITGYTNDEGFEKEMYKLTRVQRVDRTFNETIQAMSEILITPVIDFYHNLLRTRDASLIKNFHDELMKIRKYMNDCIIEKHADRPADLTYVLDESLDFIMNVIF